MNLIPVFSVILGWMLLDGSFSKMQCPAAILVMAGVYISQRRPLPVAKKGYQCP